MVTALGEIGLLLTSSFNTDEIVRVFLTTAVSITNADTGRLVLIDESKQKVVDAFEYIRGKDAPGPCKQAINLTEGVSGKILKTRRPVVISNLNRNDNLNPTERKLGAIAGVPLIARGRMLGVLYVGSSSLREFTKNDINYLATLSGQASIAINNTLLYSRISREAQEMALLYEVSQSFISTLDFDQLLVNILHRLKETFGYLNLAIMLVDEEKQELYPRSYINYPEKVKDLRFRIGRDGITGHVAATKKMYYSPDLSKDPYYVVGVEEAKSELCFPLMIGDKLIGVIDVESPQIDGFTQDDINLLSSLSAQIAISLENARLYETARKLSLTDPLTALPNRRNFDMFINAEIKRSERYHRPFSILMIDFDDFKNYNDQFGHIAGDKILQRFSQLMKETIRDVDFLGRYGGDEFVAVLPETDHTFALEVAERMRKKIASQGIKPNITLSIGIASFPQDAKDKKNLTELADQACYEAKQLGGNCVNFASALDLQTTDKK
jgi:diguanylate cyclase (GGDEF)-like protein